MGRCEEVEKNILVIPYVNFIFKSRREMSGYMDTPSTCIKQ